MGNLLKGPIVFRFRESIKPAGSRAFYGDYQAVVMPHTGHYPMLEKPEEFNRHLADILAELTKSK